VADRLWKPTVTVSPLICAARPVAGLDVKVAFYADLYDGVAGRVARSTWPG
jgi:hypothetical protein